MATGKKIRHGFGVAMAIGGDEKRQMLLMLGQEKHRSKFCD
jgi:hypothetical protein